MKREIFVFMDGGFNAQKFWYLGSVNIQYLFNLPSSFTAVPAKRVFAGKGTEGLIIVCIIG